MNRCRHARKLERDATSAAVDEARRHAINCEQCQVALASYTRFDAELAVAGHRLAGAPLPASTLAAARVFSHDRHTVARYVSVAAVIATVVVLALVAGTTVGWLIDRQPPSVGAWLDMFDTSPTIEDRVRGFEEQIQLHHLNPEAVVRLSDDYAVAAANGEHRVRVMELYLLASGRPHARELTGGEHFGRGPTLVLETSSGNTGTEWNTILFGTAPANVIRVVVDRFDAEGGQVVDGAWVIMLREKGVKPEELRWRFIDAAGNTVLQGTGITPNE